MDERTEVYLLGMMAAMYAAGMYRETAGNGLHLTSGTIRVRGYVTEDGGGEAMGQEAGR